MKTLRNTFKSAPPKLWMWIMWFCINVLGFFREDIPPMYTNAKECHFYEDFSDCNVGKRWERILCMFHLYTFVLHLVVWNVDFCLFKKISKCWTPWCLGKKDINVYWTTNVAAVYLFSIYVCIQIYLTPYYRKKNTPI